MQKQTTKFNSEEISANYEQPCVLIGKATQFKTTILLHYAYIKAKECKSPIDHGVVICSQIKLDKEDKLIFGRGDYRKQIQAELTDKIKLKYIESFSDLCKFLQVLSLAESCPKFVFVDDINYYVGADNRKLAFLLMLLRNISTLIIARHGNTNNFNVMMVWQFDTINFHIPLNNKPEETDNDINQHKIKETCILFKAYTQNLFQIDIQIQEDRQIKKANLYKVHQNYITFKMLKSVFINREFKEIIDHIKELIVKAQQ